MGQKFTTDQSFYKYPDESVRRRRGISGDLHLPGVSGDQWYQIFELDTSTAAYANEILMIHIISRFYIMDWAFATVNSADSTSPVIKLNKIRYVNNHNSGTTPLAKVVQTTNLFKGYLLASSYDSMRYYLQDSNAGAYGSANNEGGNSNLPFGLDILDPPTLYSGTPGGVLTSTAVW